MVKKKPAPAVIPPQPAGSFKEIGSGITKRHILTFTGITLPEEIAVRRSLSVPLPDTMDFAVDVAADVLDKHGIVCQPNGTYRTEDGQAHNLTFYVEAIGHRAYDSPVWYAATIFQFWLQMQEVISERSAESAAGLGFMIGLLHGEAKLKGKWEPDALLGNKDRIPRRRGGKTRGQQISKAATERNAEVLSQNEKLLPKHPNLNERAAIISRKLGRKYWTVRDILKRSK